MKIIEREDLADEFVSTDEVEDPACMSLETGDPHDVFRDYMLPRIEASSRDEASAEVLSAMRAGRSFSDAVLDTIEALPGSRTKKLRAWVEEVRGTHVYPYVRFRGDHMTYGLLLTTGGPEDKAIAREQIGEHYLPENFVGFWSALGAIEEIANKYPKYAHLFRVNPFVHVRHEKEYDAAISEMNLEVEGSGWEKPGLYDFRDEPPSFVTTVEDYVKEAVKRKAKDVLGSLEQDDIKYVCGILLDRR